MKNTISSIWTHADAKRRMQETHYGGQWQWSVLSQFQLQQSAFTLHFEERLPQPCGGLAGSGPWHFFMQSTLHRPPLQHVSWPLLQLLPDLLQPGRRLSSPRNPSPRTPSCPFATTWLTKERRKMLAIFIFLSALGLFVLSILWAFVRCSARRIHMFASLLWSGRKCSVLLLFNYGSRIYDRLECEHK